MAYAPLPQAFFDSPLAFNEAPIGNGPFMMDGTWGHDIGINVVAYPDYWGTDPAQLDGIEFRIYADVNTAITDLEGGNLDIVDSVLSERFAEVQGIVPNSETSGNTGIAYIGIPEYVEGLGGETGKNLRAALSMAVDRSLITEAIFEGLKQPAYNLLAPGLPAYQEHVCDNWDFNPDKAKELFDAAGGWDGDMTVWFNSGSGHDAWVEAVTTNG